MRIVLVGFLPDGHGRSCVEHPYGCGNALIERPDNGVGTMVWRSRTIVIVDSNLRFCGWRGFEMDGERLTRRDLIKKWAVSWKV